MVLKKKVAKLTEKFQCYWRCEPRGPSVTFLKSALGTCRGSLTYPSLTGFSVMNADNSPPWILYGYTRTQHEIDQ
jgi:hypothetical protein